MKRAATTAALMATIVTLVAVSPAFATHSASVTATSATLGAGGSVVIQGTLTCVEGYRYTISTTVRQRSGTQYNTAFDAFFGPTGTCSVTGEQTYTTNALFGQGPFHPGPATVQTSATVCDSFGWFSDCANGGELRSIMIAA